MDENILACLENFDVLWQRVSPGPSPFLVPPEPVIDPIDRLLPLWTLSCELTWNYRRLARSFQGPDRSLLLQHAEETAQQARRLKAEIFLHCGHCPTTEASTTGCEGRLQRLRRLYWQEKDLAASLTLAAQRASDRELAEILSSFSEHAGRRAEENRRLLLRCF